MSNLGDFHSGCTIFDIFTTTDTSGRPTLLAGNPPVSLVVYKEAFSQAGFCTTAGITLAITCNGLIGVQGWSVNTNSDPTFYACGNQYQVLLRGGCVDSICVSGYVVGRFSLNKDSSLKPQIHGRNCVAITASGKIEIDPCGAIFSVQRIVDADSILNVSIAQPTAIFTWPATWRGIMQWLGAVASNQIKQEAGQQGVCDRAGTTTIAKAPTTDDGTTATRGSFT